MSLVSIAAINTYNNKPLGTAYVNPDHVVAVAQRVEDPHEYVNIQVAAGGARGSETIVTGATLQSVLDALGPFIAVELRHMRNGQPFRVLHVRPAAIVAVKPRPDGWANLYLADGRVEEVPDASFFAPHARAGV